MDLEFTDEQQWTADAVAALLTRSAGPDAWPALVEFGALAIARGESDDLGAVELVLIGQELGRRLVVTPFVDSAATAYALRALPGVPAAFAAADSVGLAALEAGGSWRLAPVATRLAGGLLHGQKTGVCGPAGVEGLAVVAAGDDATRHLVLVPAAADGVSAIERPTLDSALGVRQLRFASVVVDADAALGSEDTEVALPRLLAVGGLLAGAEAVGAARSLLDLAVQYAGERRQFGRTIGSFQSLRHILADMYVKQASSWSTVLFAAAAMDEGEDDALQVAAIAKVYVARATQEIAHAAMQVFGGIAATAEHPAHLHLRRILSRGAHYGDARFHERVIGAAMARGEIAGRPTLAAPPVST